MSTYICLTIVLYAGEGYTEGTSVVLVLEPPSASCRGTVVWRLDVVGSPRI